VAEDDERTDADEVAATPAPVATAVADSDNSLGRLLTLADGVFAIAMTLLALDLAVPDLGHHATDAQLWDKLKDNSANYFSFVISFYVVAGYWVRHRTLMRSVVSIHPDLVRDTLFLLLIVAAMPFPAALLGQYGSTPLALTIYGVANLLAGLILMLLSRDVRNLKLADHDTAEEDLRYRWNSWWSLFVFALCIPAGYVLHGHGPWVLVLLAVPHRFHLGQRVARRIARRRHT
jgi:uncharacterized membrane protein